MLAEKSRRHDSALAKAIQSPRCAFLMLLCQSKSALSNYSLQFSSTNPTDGQCLRRQGFESPSHESAKDAFSPKHPRHSQAYKEWRSIAHLRDSYSGHSTWPAYILLQQHSHKPSCLLPNSSSEKRRVACPTALPRQENRTLKTSERPMDAILHGVLPKSACGVSGLQEVERI